MLQVAITCRNETVAPLAKRVRQHQLALQLPLLRTVDAEGFKLAVLLPFPKSKPILYFRAGLPCSTGSPQLQNRQQACGRLCS